MKNPDKLQQLPYAHYKYLLSVTLACLILSITGCQRETPEVAEDTAPITAETAAAETAEARPDVAIAEDETQVILVTGVTGRQGGALAAELLRRNFHVRGLTRDPSQPRALSLSESGVEIVEGDFGEPDKLEIAMQEVYGVFLNTPNVPEQVTFAQNVIDAAKTGGVRHIVYSSNLSAHPDYVTPNMPKALVEQMVRDSGIDYTILRPVTFMENYAGLREEIATNGIRDPRRPDTRQQFISVRDIAFFAAEAFEKPILWVGSEENIASDELTNAELAALFSNILGTPVSFEQLTWEKWGENVPPRLVELHRWSEDSSFHVNVAALREENPKMMTFERYLREAWGQEQAAGGR